MNFTFHEIGQSAKQHRLPANVILLLRALIRIRKQDSKFDPSCTPRIDAWFFCDTCNEFHIEIGTSNIDYFKEVV